jgi:hypothetical protein
VALADVILATQPASLKGYWKCDETSGTTLADSSGNAKDLALLGGYTLGVSGQAGNAVQFLGVNGYAWRGDSVIGSNLPSEFTMLLLVKGSAGQTAAAATGVRVFAFGSSATANNHLDIGSGGSGADPCVRGFFRRTSGGGQVNTSHGGIGFLNDWRMVMFRKTTSHVWDIWTGDQPVQSLSHTPSSVTFNTTALGAILRPTATFFANAAIQHACVWTKALTDEEYAAIYAASGLAASNPTPYGFVTSLGSSDADLSVGNCQGCAYDGTHYYFSESGILYKYTRSGNTYTLVASRDVTGDNPTDKTQINGMNYHDGYLWIGANNFSGTSPKKGWAIKYNPADLTWVSTHSVGANWSEGGAWRNGEYWAVYTELHATRRYDSNFNLIGQYNFPLLVADTTDEGYQGAAWRGDLLHCTTHTNSLATRTDVHKWNGTSFEAYQSIPALGDNVGQGLHWETPNSVMLFAERVVGGTQRLIRASMAGGEELIIGGNRRRRIICGGAA